MLNYFAVLTLVLAVCGAQAADDYKLGPDSQFKADVPHGRIERFQFTNSTVFPGTVRDGGVYIPAQYDPSKPAALMVFQDGIGYLSTNGGWRVPLVFDNLIAANEMPVTIAIFLNPGSRAGQVRFVGGCLCEVFDQRSDSVRDEQVFIGDHGRSGAAGDLRIELRRDLRVYSGLGAAGSVSQGAFDDWEFYQYSRGT